MLLALLSLQATALSFTFILTLSYIAVYSFCTFWVANMFCLRTFSFATALLVCQALAVPLHSSVAPLKVGARNGVEDVELRPIARSSEKRDKVNNLVPRSTTLHLDYVDGKLQCPLVTQQASQLTRFPRIIPCRRQALPGHPCVRTEEAYRAPRTL